MNKVKGIVLNNVIERNTEITISFNGPCGPIIWNHWYIRYQYFNGGYPAHLFIIARDKSQEFIDNTSVKINSQSLREMNFSAKLKRVSYNIAEKVYSEMEKLYGYENSKDLFEVFKAVDVEEE